jgi:O-antigen/teichoic acid export membrane protein
MTHQFNGAAAIRGAMMVMGSTYVTYALGLLTSILVARTLGPDEFGRYTYIVWMAGMIIAFGNNGLTTTAIRFVSESLGRGSVASARSVHGWLLRRQLACLALVALVFAAATPVFTPAGWGGRTVEFAAVALLAGCAKAMFVFDVSVAKGYGRFGVEAKSTVLMSFLNIVAVFVLLWMRAPLMAYLLLFTATSIGYVACSTLMLRAGGQRPSRELPPPELTGRMRRHLWWTVLLALAYALSNKSIETWMLNAVVGSAAVGYFAIAAALTRGGVDLLASGLGTVLMPMMAHAYGEGGPDRVNLIMANAIRYFAFIGLLLAGSGALVADTAVKLLYGAQYEAVVNPLRVMILVGGITMVTGAFNALLSTTDNQRLRVGYVLLSIVLTAAFAIALIPTYGLAGAVAAHAVSELLVFVLMIVGISRLLKLRLPWRELSRMAACAAAATLLAVVPLFAWGINIWSELAAALIYAAVFVPGTILVRAWRALDVHSLDAFLQRYPFVSRRVQGPLLRWGHRLPADGVHG